MRYFAGVKYPRILALGALVGLLACAGCTADPLAAQYRAGDSKGYIAGDGAVVEFPEGQRGDPVTFTGTAADGSAIDSSEYQGDVLVVNFWWAGCGPCRIEARPLQAASEKYADQGVAFLGVNVRDQPSSIDSFDKGFGVAYPSIVDGDSGRVQLAFAGARQLNSTPVTLVVDKTGRVAATLLGPITDQPGTLDSLITTALGT